MRTTKWTKKVGEQKIDMDGPSPGKKKQKQVKPPGFTTDRQGNTKLTHNCHGITPFKI